jgi:hypothetical protein
MTLAEPLLEKLDKWRPADGGRQRATFNLPDAGWDVTLTADRVDSVGSLLTRIEATRTNPVPEDANLLEAHAQAAAGRATGLLEPLRLVELDRVGNVALLRSGTPSQRGESVLFYEVRFQGRNQVSVERIRANKTAPAGREPVPFALTNEALAKLVSDLIEG